MTKHKKITAQERDTIARLLASGCNKSEIARELGRPRETVVREIARNGSWVKDVSGKRIFVYSAISAQTKWEERQQISAHNKVPLKNKDLYEYVTTRLRWSWSPKQIEGRLKNVEHKGDSHWAISHETIYDWIYRQPPSESGQYWYEYLRRKQKKRKKQSGRSVHRSHIPDRISIHKRSEAANNRTEFGHWEGDSVEGVRLTKAAVHTEVERMSRVLRAVKVEAITSEAALIAQQQIFSKEPSEAVKSTTIDNGRETHHHATLRTQFDMMTYHADPYSSWQRGSNENGNLWFRYYFPKRTDFTQVDEADILMAVEEINNRPREIHNYLTANEIYYKLLKKDEV